MSGNDVRGKMREDWNRRAREDANYFVAFGRRDQDDAEFFSTGAPVVRNLDKELRWILRGPGARGGRALEIGCGPGRLMRPMSDRFREVHGVDVSDEMVRLAREKLRDVPNAHVRSTSGADLADFEDGFFDFVYSYAVFQHIPSREVVLRYLDEAIRVLAPGGLLRCQLNGLPETAAIYDTWHGVRIRAEEIRDLARRHAVRLLALEGVSTQYMWITVRKPLLGEELALRPPAWLRRITNAHTSEPVAPSAGRFASISIWTEDLPAECDLLGFEVYVGGQAAETFYIGAPDIRGLHQINVRLPEGLGTGIQPVRLTWRGGPLCPETWIRIIPPGPAVPRIISATDAIDLLSGARIVSGFIKVTIEEADRPEELAVFVDIQHVPDLDVFCTDPVPPRYEINFRVPESVAPGPRLLEIALGRRRFPPFSIEIVG